MHLCDGKGLERRLALWYDVLVGNMHYLPGTVDTLLDYEAVEMNDQTAAHLYTDFTPLEIHYEQGSRPFMEEMVARAVKHGMSQRETMVAITRWIGARTDWPPRRQDLPRFMGGTEEEIIQKGGGQCNETAMMQIAGIPARQCGHWTGSFQPPRVGHMTNEVYIEGKWRYVDATRAVMFDVDGTLASAWALKQNNDIIRDAPDETFAGPLAGRQRDTADTRRLYLDLFHPGNVTSITNYPISARHLYNYDREVRSEEMTERIKTQSAALVNRLRRRMGLPEQALEAWKG